MVLKVQSSSDLEASTNKVFVGLGANINNPQHQVLTAIESLRSLPESHLIKTSSLYMTPPMGPQEQNDFVNAVALLETKLLPLDLLNELQKIEDKQGRVRKNERWGPRTLDIDILLYNNSMIEHPRLTIPHYGMKERSFVLVPLAEIEPHLNLPDGTLLKDLLELVDKQEIRKL